MTAYLVLRIPRAEGATVMSGVLNVEGHEYVEESATIPAVCDALAARVPGCKPLLVDPLDGRHGLAHVVLEEATKRGWEFGRHPPLGLELLLLDLEGADAARSMSKEDATTALERLAAGMGEAWNDSELGESMGIGRQALTLCLHHFGAWHPYTFWIMSNLFQASAGTGNGDNIREACAFVDYLLTREKPATYEGASGFLVRLDELAHRCLGVDNVALATRVYDAAVEIARATYGEAHGTYQQVVERKAASLPSA